MTTESLEELQRRLLQQDSVQRMIQMRAYEIYQMRGCQPGGEAQDWFHAEGEVLAFLIASESTRSDEPVTAGVQFQPAPEPAPLENTSIKKRATKPRSPRSDGGAQTARQSTASKRAATKKSTKPKAKSARPRNSSKPESTE
ncbi:MAG TPA: DUF2934 domain-containing protein [Blastocatellia bacterium]|nr:DUF2934 domain-containing protein [Blastocatellia bacterium]